MDSTHVQSTARRSLLFCAREPGQPHALRPALEAHGWRVQVCAGQRTGLLRLLRNEPAAAVIEIGNGAEDLAFVREARRMLPWIPLVVLAEEVPPALQAALKSLETPALQAGKNSPEVLAQELDETLTTWAREMREGSSASIPPRVLQSLGERALAAESIREALTTVREAMAPWLPSTLSALLLVDHRESNLAISAEAETRADFIATLRDDLLGTWEILDGHRIDPAHLRLDSPATLEEDSASPFTPPARNRLTVPLFLDDKLQGLFVLASMRREKLSWKEVHLLHQATQTLATVMLALGRLRQLTVRDKLTNIYNRENLEAELGRNLAMSNRYGFPLSVVVIDVDHFKKINDTYGHLTGDRVLRDLSAMIRQTARSSDILGRYGGDELVVVLPHVGREGAARFGMRLLGEVRQKVFFAQEHGIRLTISIGVAANEDPLHTPLDSQSLFSAADKALYKAKRLGRNRLVSAPPARHAVEVPTSAPKEDSPPKAQIKPTAKVSSPRKDYQGTAKAAYTEETRPRLLVADDNVALARVVQEMLDDEFEVEIAASVPETEAILADPNRDVDVLLLDINFPGGSGFHVLETSARLENPPVTVMVTGVATTQNAIESLRAGAYDFIPKPFRTEQIRAVVQRATEFRRLRQENQRYQNDLESMVRQRSAALSEALRETERSYRFTLEALVALLDERTDDTSAHSRRVRHLARCLGQEMKLTEKELEDLDKGALLHDIGKLAIPDAIMHKPGALTEDERRVMRAHPEIGYNVLRTNPYLQEAADIVRFHHERFDGRGYPLGLAGTDICLGARIFAIIDAYDAMRSNRVYRRALPPEVARQEILDGAGQQYDPKITEAFARLQPRFEDILDELAKAELNAVGE